MYLLIDVGVLAHTSSTWWWSGEEVTGWLAGREAPVVVGRLHVRPTVTRPEGFLVT